MLKKYFITVLGSLTAIWISVMLGVVLLMGAAITSVLSLAGSQAATVKVAKHSILYLKLDCTIEEQRPEQDIYSVLQKTKQSLLQADLIGAIKVAETDKNIDGIFIDCAGSTAGMATRQAVLQTLQEFKDNSGKWVVTYGAQISQGDYYMTCAASDIYVNPQGSIDLRGLASGIPFFKNALDKLGVEMQVVKVGTFKSAVEPFILTSMSEANRLQTQTYLESIWGEIKSGICENRNISLDKLDKLADEMLLVAPAEYLVENSLVTDALYRYDVLKLLAEKTGKDEPEDLEMVTVDEYLASGIELPNSKKRSRKIAVYYAVGDITESDSKGIASDNVVPDIIELANDDDIDALVLRVNSGGGSAYASEQIWHALEIFKKTGKTFYVSMGDVAASGGYYISCGADKIYAQPVTLTGSIGIFGMIPCAKELLNDKIGVNFDFVTTNTNAVGITPFEPMTAAQRQAMQGYVERGYDLFTRRCADGRHMSQDSIKAIGEGRVWAGIEALNIGLVDQLGTLDDAIADIAQANGYDKYQVLEYPNRKQTFWDIISDLNMDVRAEALRREMGAFYPVYVQLQTLSTMDPLQARMPVEVIF